MTLITDVSVLYVDAKGLYPHLVADWWDETDAKAYDGPNPVVAHPAVRTLGAIAALMHPAGSHVRACCGNGGAPLGRRIGAPRRVKAIRFRRAAEAWRTRRRSWRQDLFSRTSGLGARRA